MKNEGATSTTSSVEEIKDTGLPILNNDRSSCQDDVSNSAAPVVENYNKFKPVFFVNKHLPVTLLHKFDLTKVFRPIQQQVSKISDFIALAYHPNYGGVNFLNPSYFWEMLKEKKHNLFSNAHLSVFGNGQSSELDDYPFAYRKG